MSNIIAEVKLKVTKHASGVASARLGVDARGTLYIITEGSIYATGSSIDAVAVFTVGERTSDAAATTNGRRIYFKRPIGGGSLLGIYDSAYGGSLANLKLNNFTYTSTMPSLKNLREKLTKKLSRK